MACLLIHRGLWTGPVALLCPAATQIASHMREESAMRRILETPLPASTHGIIVHGTEDSIVPLAHSRELLKSASNMRLVEAADADHSLSSVRPLVKAVLESHPAEWHRHNH